MTLEELEKGSPMVNNHNSGGYDSDDEKENRAPLRIRSINKNNMLHDSSSLEHDNVNISAIKNV